jgi:predicted transcriptional regulator
MDTSRIDRSHMGRIYKTVAEVMHLGVITCPLDTPVPEIARLLSAHDISAIPVVNADGTLAGIVTRTDLVALRAHEDYWREMRAEHVMVRDVATTTTQETVAHASKVMSDRHIHRLIVVAPDDDNRPRPVGVLSQTDIVRDMALE